MGAVNDTLFAKVRTSLLNAPYIDIIYSMKRVILTFFSLSMIVASASAMGNSERENTDGYRVGVFVPGVVDGSPTYEMLVAGVTRAVNEAQGATVSVIEGGFNQATWEEGVMSMAAGGGYDLIVTSNPSMPEIVQTVTEAVPQVAFIVVDGYLAGNDRIHTVMFNQREQAFLSGYFAGLVTQGALENANEAVRVGLLVGQEYPIMNEVILPSFQLGLRSVVADGEVDFRVLGNWFDAGKAQEIAADMINLGSDIILTIAGGGNQGVIAAAREAKTYVLWYDDSGYEQAPGVVVGSSFVRQDEAAYEATAQAIGGELTFGQARVIGVADGAVSFDTEHREFVRYVPQTVRDEMHALLDRLQSGDLELAMPGLPATR